MVLGRIKYVFYVFARRIKRRRRSAPLKRLYSASFSTSLKRRIEFNAYIMLCLISYYNVRKLSRQSVLTPVSFTAHGHMFALTSFSEPIASFGRLKPRVSGDENVDLAPILLFPACSRNIMALWRKTFVTEPIPGAVIRCFISRQLVSA